MVIPTVDVFVEFAVRMAVYDLISDDTKVATNEASRIDVYDYSKTNSVLATYDTIWGASHNVVRDAIREYM